MKESPGLPTPWLIAMVAVLLGVPSVVQDALGAEPAPSTSRELGLASWRQMETVLRSPRCLNCHTGTDYPRQGDDRHEHLFGVSSGTTRTGVPGLKCVACHGSSNFDPTGVPGAAGWRLAPMAMSWEGAPGVARSGTELCALLSDPKRNGHRSGQNLVEHNDHEPLVRWAWSPGRRRDGSARATPGLSHEEFAAATRSWVANGMPCP